MLCQIDLVDGPRGRASASADGQNAIVGPRPVVPDEISHYGSDARVFLAVKPGLTGQWQVSGRSDVAYPERAQLDIDYINNWGLGRDFRILWER